MLWESLEGDTIESRIIDVARIIDSQFHRADIWPMRGRIKRMTCGCLSAKTDG